MWLAFWPHHLLYREGCISFHILYHIILYHFLSCQTTIHHINFQYHYFKFVLFHTMHLIICNMVEGTHCWNKSSDDSMYVNKLMIKFSLFNSFFKGKETAQANSYSNFNFIKNIWSCFRIWPIHQCIRHRCSSWGRRLLWDWRGRRRLWITS